MMYGNLKNPDHPKYSDAVRQRWERRYVQRRRRLEIEERDAAYNAWFHDGVIMRRAFFGHWEPEP